MAYSGYLLKINNVSYSNFYIVQSSYKPENNPIILSEYYDANYNKHVEYAEKDDFIISFSLRMLYQDEYISAIAPFGTDEMNVEYYDTKSGTYKTGVFTCSSNLTPTIHRINNGRIIYAEQSIVLTKKR